MSITSLIDRLTPQPEPTQLHAESPVVIDEANAWDVFRNRRRRQVIAEVANSATGETLTTREVAEQIAAFENEKSASKLSSTEYKRTYIPLYQDHLPKLDDAGIIDFDKPRNTIRATEKTEPAARVLTAAHGSPVFQGGDAQ